MLLSIVIPCYNEEKVIAHTLDILIKKMDEYSVSSYEIIIVNDGSKDASLQILENYAQNFSSIKIVSFAANRGQQIAFYAGMCYSSGETVILMDADLQDPPECIPEMLRLWKEGYQVVYGKRAIRDGETISKRFTAFLFYRLLNMLSYTKIPQDVGEFRLMDRVVVDTIINIGEHNRFNRALVSWLGFNQTELIFERPERCAGETKFGWKEMLSLAKDGVFSFSFAPIYIVQFIGVTSIFVSIFLLFYVFVSGIFGHITPGWSSLMIVVSFFSGSILFSLGIIGEYISRIYTEVIQRPLFVSAQTINLKNKTLPPHISRYISTHNNKLK